MPCKSIVLELSAAPGPSPTPPKTTALPTTLTPPPKKKNKQTNNNRQIGKGSCKNIKANLTKKALQLLECNE